MSDDRRELQLTLPPQLDGGRTEVIPGEGEVQFQRCRLVRLDGPRQGEAVELNRDATVVGSEVGCDLLVRDTTVSRRHFSIVVEEGRYLLRDEGSTNGTFVDDLRVKEAYLAPGAVLRAGNVGFRFELAYEAAALEPASEAVCGDLVGASLAMRRVFAAVQRVAPTSATVLLCGETGTGKGALAWALHRASSRGDGPLVVFDCGATQANLVESQLFGHEKGAFTGATELKRGALEEAAGGTLFIDELADLSLSLQPKLLRALEEREFTRVGSTRPLKLDCRVVAATQVDLWQEVEAKRFRQDLYFRLAVVIIALPPLRDRREDILLLVDRFLGAAAGPGPRRFAELDAGTRERLLAHAWPGNIRELRNVVERLRVMGEAGPLTAAPPPVVAAPHGDGDGDQALVCHVDATLSFKEAKDRLVGQFEAEYVRRLLARSGNNVSQAARTAQLGRRHLYTLMAKYGIRGEDDPPAP